MKTLPLLIASATITLTAGIATQAAPIALTNPGFETGDKLPWAPSGSYYTHGATTALNNGSLGTGFAYYSPQAANSELVVQATGVTIESGYLYTFKSWATGDGGGSERIGFVLAYDNGTGDLSDGIDASEVTVFASSSYDLADKSWAAIDGVTAAGTTEALGKELVVGWGPNDQSQLGNYDGGGVWFDQAEASYEVPEPSSLALIGLGGLALIRRRRG